MSGSRLDLALTGGALTLPGEGKIAVFAPTASTDLTPLPSDRMCIITGHFPDHALFQSRGLACVTHEGGDRFVAAVVCLPRAKTQARDMIARAAAATDGPVIVDGQRHDGVDSILRACRGIATVSGPVNKAHGKLFWFEGGDFSGWHAPVNDPIDGRWHTAPGVFSADGVDPASRLLGDLVADGFVGRFADLGAGWGYLSARLLETVGVTSVDLVEADHAALGCARVNVTDPRARFHWADATRWRPDAMLDGIIMNPPFHSGRAADPGLGRTFIAAARGMLRPGGRIWMVANRHLPYEATLSDHFSDVTEIGGDSRFKVLRGAVATRQRR